MSVLIGATVKLTFLHWVRVADLRTGWQTLRSWATPESGGRNWRRQLWNNIPRESWSVDFQAIT